MVTYQLIDHIINLILFGIGCFMSGYFYGRKRLTKQIENGLVEFKKEFQDKILEELKKHGK